MANEAFVFTKLIVGDLDRSAAFYRDVAGLTEERRIEGAAGGRPMTEIILGGGPAGAATLILYTHHGEPAPIPGDSILGFSTDDIAGFIDRLRKAGGTVTQDITDLPDHRLKFALATDSEGHIVEAIERY